MISYARNPSKIELKHEALSVVQGQLADAALLEKAITSADCVISLLGPSGSVYDTALSNGVKNIIATMERVGVQRLIQLVTLSVTDPNDGKDLRSALMVGLVKRLLPGSYAEIVRIGQAVRASKLDWTLVRVPLLNDKPQTRNVHVGYLGQGIVRTAVSRADVAWFMLEQADKEEYLRKGPAISN